MSSTIFMTETGSIYEVDGLKARRAEGQAAPTERMTGGWKELACRPVIEVGSSVLFEWADGIVPPPALGTVPATLTSRVVEIMKFDN